MIYLEVLVDAPGPRHYTILQPTIWNISMNH